MKREHHAWMLARTLAVAVLLSFVSSVSAEGVDPAGRPIAETRITGLVEVPETLVRNQLRAVKGTPYSKKTVADDIVRITHLGRFSSIRAKVEQQKDLSIILTYVLIEEPLLLDVQIIGNKLLTDEYTLGDLTQEGWKPGLVGLRPGDPIDSFLIDQGRQRIETAYHGKGFHKVEVSYDKVLLKQKRILIYIVREGPFITIRRVDFEGNRVFTDELLINQVQSQPKHWFMRKGILNPEQLDADIAKIRKYYHDRGYLDAVVGRRIVTAANQVDAMVVFFIEEGRQYLVKDVETKGNVLFSNEQIKREMTLKIGDVFSEDKRRKSQQALIDMYGKLGFISTRIVIEKKRNFDQNAAHLTVQVTILEGRAHTVGRVIVKGNRQTQDRVILRQVRGMSPGRPFDRSGMEYTERRLSESSLFRQAKITILGDDNDKVRDALVEVLEGTTASATFGAGISSDSGVLGSISWTQRNFDINDTPESLSEFFSGQAFKGAGQYFSLNLQPGDEFSNYSVSFTEPYLFDSEVYMRTRFFIFERDRDEDVWNETRYGGQVEFGKRFGDVWSAGVVIRAEQVDITDIQADAPVDVFAVMGDSLVTSVGFAVTRDTTNSRIFPTQGSRTVMGLHRVGAIGGDYDFTKASLEHRVFVAIDEDFMGRKTVIMLRGEVAYIIERNEAPFFERFYTGGRRFRGFEFRGIGPIGIAANTGLAGDDHVGGDFLLFLGGEYNFPIYEKMVRGVIFIDTGTLDHDVNMNSYRITIGAGVRIALPAFGPVPIAIDFGIPIKDADGDEDQLISFDVAFPF